MGQYNLGNVYAQGRGVVKDEEEEALVHPSFGGDG
jgi:TPR repeat protein